MHLYKLHQSIIGEEEQDLHQPLIVNINDNVIPAREDKAFQFIRKHINIGSKKTLVISTASHFGLKKLPADTYSGIANLKRINDIKLLNKFFETINVLLPIGSTFIGFGETKAYRKKRILKKLPFVLNYIIYSFDFIFTRIFPKLPLIKKIYFFITKGRNNILSRAEMLGRLYSCGFEVIEEQFITNNFYFAVRKKREPFFDYNSACGLITKIRKVGKNGKIIGVYKFRTMHPYSEYLYDYILEQNGYNSKGKPSNDFRVTKLGRILRKFWLDELPQLYNVLKGEMKLVGARPLSQSTYDEYPEDVKKIRDKYKPGCFPPYVALLMQNMDDMIKSERIYLLEKEKHPRTTDIKYFFRAVYNIITNKIRSA